jgi:hypothetical protein
MQESPLDAGFFVTGDRSIDGRHSPEKCCRRGMAMHACAVHNAGFAARDASAQPHD